LIPKSDTSEVLKCAISITSDSVSSYCSALTADDITNTNEQAHATTPMPLPRAPMLPPVIKIKIN